MPLDLRNLDDVTRGFMVDEVEQARKNHQLYFSKRFNGRGYERWPELLLEAARDHDDHWLAYQLEKQRLIKGLEGSRTPSGGYTIKHVPDTAAITIAEGEFNRFYMLAVCRRALAEGRDEVVIYRAKEVCQPRRESQRIVGQSRHPEEVMRQLRSVQASFESELAQPNSGLSVRL